MIPDWLAQEVAEYDMDLAEPPDVVLDIGANIGAFALRAHERWPNAQILAYEPIEENFETLRQNAIAVESQTGNIYACRSAVGSVTGTRDIFKGKSHTSSSFHQIGGQTSETEEVQCMNAKGLPSADFVKIDVEGSELEVLEGIPLKDAKALAVEYHRYEDVDKIRAIVEAAGLAMVVNKRHFSLPGHGILKFARPGALKPIPNSLFIGVPVYGGMEPLFVKSLIKFMLNPPVSPTLDFKVGDSLVARARNALTMDFLKTECTHLLFIDSDLVFSGEQVARLLAHNKEIIGGFYPKKTDGPVQWVCNGMDGKLAPEADGLQELRYIGTGFMLVHRNVFERMIAAYGGVMAYHPEHSPQSVEYDFWSVGPYRYSDGGCRYLSEDWFFCQRWLDLGGKVWGDPHVILKHVGQAVYPLKTQVPDLTAKPSPAPSSDQASERMTVMSPARAMQSLTPQTV